MNKLTHPPQQAVQVYSAAQVAAMLDVNIKTVQRLCRRGELQAVKRLRKWYITDTALRNYLTPQTA